MNYFISTAKSELIIIAANMFIAQVLQSEAMAEDSTGYAKICQLKNVKKVYKHPINVFL